LGNLLDNALRYGVAPTPDVQPHVTVVVTQRGDVVTMSVIDNGPGLSPQEAEQLRQRWTLGPAGLQLGEGTGLGLAIVSRYADLLGARFSLEAAPSGQGLQAKVTFA
jgi:two-component system, OmpR family, sensor histidine kinase TctE